MIFSFQQNARPGMSPTTPGKVPFRCKKHTPPPVAGSRGQGEGVAGWLVAGWLGGWVAGWLAAGGWVGWVKVIGFDYYMQKLSGRFPWKSLTFT